MCVCVCVSYLFFFHLPLLTCGDVILWDTVRARTFFHMKGNLGEHGPDAFVITGDIDAMWLRDSCNQLLPFVPFVNEDPELLQLLAGAVSRQAHQVNADPWANAHTYEGRSMLRLSCWSVRSSLFFLGGGIYIF